MQVGFGGGGGTDVLVGTGLGLGVAVAVAVAAKVVVAIAETVVPVACAIGGLDDVCPVPVLVVPVVLLPPPAPSAVPMQEHMTQATSRPAQPLLTCIGRDCRPNQAVNRDHQPVACDMD